MSTTADASALADVDASAPPDAMAATPPPPQLLAAIDGSPQAIALDATHAYVLSSRDTKWKLSRVAKSGGSLATLDDFEAASLSFAIDDADAFVGTALVIHEASNGGAFRLSAFGRISSGPKAGGTRRTLYEAIGRSARGLAIGGPYLFWLNGAVNRGGGVTVDAVMRTAKGGGATTYAATQQIGATSIAADAANVYFAMEGRLDPRAGIWPAGSIMKMPVAGGPARAITATAPQPSALAIDDAFVYWMHGDGSVMRVAQSGGVPQSIADHATRYVVDAERVWWIGHGGIVSRPKDGSGDAVRRDVATAPRVLAVDESHVYFADAGALWRIVKVVPRER